MKKEQIAVVAYKERKFVSYSELAVSLLVSVKIDGLGNFWNN
jgi:hypothetical protein